MLKIQNFRINSVFEEFFFKKLLGILLMSCQNLLSVHTQVLLTKDTMRIFAFALNSFTDFKFIRKSVSNKTSKLFDLPLTKYARKEQMNLLSFKEQGSLEEFLKKDASNLERDWIDPVRYQPTFSRARTFIKDIKGNYETLYTFDGRKNTNILNVSNRKPVTLVEKEELFMKKIYKYLLLLKKQKHTVIYKKKSFPLDSENLNLLKIACRTLLGTPSFVPQSLQDISVSLSSTKMYKIISKNIKINKKHLKLENNFNLIRIENYITKVLHTSYISWVLTQKATTKTNFKYHELIYNLIYTQLLGRISKKIAHTVYVQAIYNKLLLFIYKKEFNKLIKNSLVNKKICYHYIHRLLISLLLVDLSIIVNFIALRIHKTKKTKRLQKKMLNTFKRIFGEFKRNMTLDFVGFYFQIKGKLKGKRRKSRWLFKIGSFPLTQDTLDYTYSYSQAVSRFGAYGVRCQLITKKQ